MWGLSLQCSVKCGFTILGERWSEHFWIGILSYLPISMRGWLTIKCEGSGYKFEGSAYHLVWGRVVQLMKLLLLLLNSCAFWELYTLCPWHHHLKQSSHCSLEKTFLTLYNTYTVCTISIENQGIYTTFFKVWQILNILNSFLQNVICVTK